MMDWLKQYILPTVIVTVASCIVCIGLWTVYVSGDNAGEVEIAIEEIEETDVLNLGILTPLILFMASGVKVAALMGIPGLITIFALRVIDRKPRTATNT